MTPAATLHALSGSPAIDHASDVTAVCWVCGTEQARTLPLKKWQASKSATQEKSRALHASRVCEACVWSCMWVPPPGMEKPAKGRGPNLCLYTHLHDERGYSYENKASKPAILLWLRGPKVGAWFACIADSGKKQTVPFAQTNHTGVVAGMVRFEDRDVRIPGGAGGWLIVDECAALLTAGATKGEVSSGDYRPSTYERCAAMVRGFETAHGRARRGSAWFDLVVWLAQRDEEAVAVRQKAEKDEAKRRRGADRRDGKRGAVASGAVPKRRRQRAEALEPDRGQDEVRAADERESVGVGRGDGEEPVSVSDKQLGLF